VSQYKISGSHTISQRDIERTIVKYSGALSTLSNLEDNLDINVHTDGRRRRFKSIDTAMIKMLHHSPSLGEKFVSEFLTGEVDDSFPCDKNPVIALREYALKDYLRFRGQTGQNLIHAATCLAIHNYIKDIPTESINEDELTDKTSKNLKVTYHLDWDNI
jgi:hypothetical protein